MTKIWHLLRDRVMALGTGRSRRIVVTSLLTLVVGGAVVLNFALFGVLKSNLSKQPPIAAASPQSAAGGTSGAQSAQAAGGSGAPGSGSTTRLNPSRPLAFGGGSGPASGPAIGTGPVTGNEPVLGGPSPGNGPSPGHGPPPANGSPPNNGPPTPGLAEFPLPVLAVVPLFAVMALTLTWRRKRPRGRTGPGAGSGVQLLWGPVPAAPLGRRGR